MADDQDAFSPIPLNRDQRLIAKIEKLMANPPEGSVVLVITPAVARHILKNWRGIHNRHEKPTAIGRYAVDMAKEPSGWLLNGSTVVFTDQHLLGDGQNRLIACIRADRPFRTHVIFGVPHEYFYSMDQGRVRGPADILTIEGVSNASMVYPAVRWAELLSEPKTIKRRTTFTPPEILELYRTKHKLVEDFLPEARNITRTNEHQAQSQVMALLYHFDLKDTDLAGEFSEKWHTGPLPGSFRAIQIMQELLKLEAKKNNTRIHDVVRAAMIINAWNIVRDGVKPHKGLIEWNLTMAFPVIT